MRACDSAHIHPACWQNNGESTWGQWCHPWMQEWPGLHTPSHQRKELLSQPRKCENWEGQCPMSSGLTAGRTARENQSQAMGEGLAQGHSVVSGLAWTEASPSQARTLALTSYNSWLSQHPQVQSFSLPMLSGGNCRWQSYPLNSGINKVESPVAYMNLMTTITKKDEEENYSAHYPSEAFSSNKSICIQNNLLQTAAIGKKMHWIGAQGEKRFTMHFSMMWNPLCVLRYVDYRRIPQAGVY